MIPKKIHYCWFGGKPVDKLGERCIASWRKFFPDYEIIQWNESNFDINCCQYAQEAHNAGKWAFVSDYARFKILYDQGGIYFDTDVEVIKSLDDILDRGNFMGCERSPADGKNDIAVAPGLGMAMIPGMSIAKELLEDYESSTFLKENGAYDQMTIVHRTTKHLQTHGLKNSSEIQMIAELNIYPHDYFCPMDLDTGKINITQNTRAIHHYAASWVSKTDLFRGRVYKLLSRTFGKEGAEFVRRYVGRKH